MSWTLSELSGAGVKIWGTVHGTQLGKYSGEKSGRPSSGYKREMNRTSGLCSLKMLGGWFLLSGRA